jgi:acyl-CoA synthetase (AMP-forming)/AMP-acid ligase II
MYTTDEVSSILSDADARAIVVAEPFVGTIAGLRETLPMLEHVVVAGTSAPVGAMTWEQMLGRAGEASLVTPSDDELAVIAYTSGTTGKPKGAMLTHGNLLANLDQMAQAPLLAEAEGDVALLALPMFHIYALNVILGLTLRVGASAVLMERFDAVGSLDAVERHKVTILFGAPPMFVAWLNTPGVDRYDLSSVRLAISGAAPLPGAVLEDFRRRLGITIWEGYGLTETAPGGTLMPETDWRRKLATAGKPFLHVDLRVVDADGGVLRPGEVGEVQFHGPNVFAGYWRQPDATAEAFTADGWFKTGDLGRVDDEGFLTLVDRKKDMVISGGENVYSAEVEDVLFAHPAVAEAAVIGVADERWGEAVCAVVALRPNASATAEELIAHCRTRLAKYKTPKVVVFVTTLPRNAAGKVLKRQLREEVGARERIRT